MKGKEGAPPSLGDLAAATPASRDRYVDLLRVLSIGVVVLGHWLIAIVYLRDGRVSGASALDVIPGVWILTWGLQVMPIFFFVGGFSHATAWDSAVRKGWGYSGFVKSRIERLMRPTLAFVVAWTILALIAEFSFDVGDGFVRATSLIAKPLWFLAIYMILVAAAPGMLFLHRRYRLLVPLVLAVGALGVDLLRIGAGVPGVGYLNFALVWLLPHQLGFFYADGSLVELGRARQAVLAAGGLAALVVLINIGVYSPSMVGMNSDKVSNNDPPTICLIALSVWLIGLAMLIRDPLRRWLERRDVWTGVIAANSVVMTVFLWHLSALLLAVTTLYPLGWPQYRGGTSAWWLTRVPWIACLALFLAPLVQLFRRFERVRSPAGPGERSTPVVSIATAIVLLVAGLTGFALGGFSGIAELGSGPLLGAPPPLLSAICLALGMGMVGLTRRSP